ncbi:hypothetical protein DyAD56_22990 [Dyella sp. AD56]|uniref:hypothetical protein n=1 Tax=Dyella sp. AD56 TaxID=1528744 RepID=UPI000C84A0B0|nr:hypothetical protein [Dyella sp. AD56]PMQ02745.1 hypothetical protein DyAD56_22990 [Dyella sp. AD56]
MATRYKQERWYWPSFGNMADAEQAANQGFWAAVFVAAVATLFATISAFSSHNVMGIDPFAYVDAVVFAVIAWRIRRRSRAFAIAGLVLFTVEKIFQFTTQPLALVGILMAIVLFVCFINAVRGTFAYHRMLVASAQEPAPANS